MRFYVFLLYIVFFSQYIFAQTAQAGSENVLPASYNEISLGMTAEQVKEALSANPLFGYRGERDVSLLPVPTAQEQKRMLIETNGHSFLSRCWFQFYDNKLYIMTFTINPDMMDYYSLFKTFETKYGQPSSLSPEKIVWKNDTVTFSLERPLTVRYVDTAVFNSLLDQSQRKQAASDILREEFLNAF